MNDATVAALEALAGSDPLTDFDEETNTRD